MKLKNEMTEIPALSRTGKSLSRFGHLRQKLDSFAKLPDEWNGPCSKAIERDTIERAQRILSDILLAIPDESVGRIRYLEAFPISDGGIQFESATRKRAIEIEITPASPLLEILKEDNSTGEEVMTEESVSTAEVQGIIDWLLE